MLLKRLFSRFSCGTKLFTILLSVFLFGCSTSNNSRYSSTQPPSVKQQQPDLQLPYHPSLGNEIQLVDEQAIFALKESQKQQFLEFYERQVSAGVKPNMAVYKFIDSISGNFNYHSGTFTAQESLERLEGNCLSLAILTTALARVVNIDIHYQLMATRPVFLKQGNTLFTSQHVRSLLYDPTYQKDKDTIVMMRPMIIIDYFPTSRGSVQRLLEHQEFVSLYYRNIAADAIARKQYDQAYWLARKSLDYAANNDHAVNMIAVILDKVDADIEAERVYLYGTKYAESKLEIYTNYRNFLRSAGRAIEAQEVDKKIQSINQPNPFEWLSLGDKELNKGNLTLASYFYDRVIKIAPYLHHGFEGRAKVEYLRGNKRKARDAFEQAITLATTPESDLLLNAKLSALQQHP